VNEHAETSMFESFWKTNLPTRNFFVVILLVYIIMTIITLATVQINDIIDFFTISENILEVVGQYNAKVYSGHIYQLFTSIFVHVNILHFLSNSLFLLIFGLRAEERILSWHYYLIFIISGLMGGLISLSFGPNVISAGASGGIFGLLGTDIILAYEENKRRSLWSHLGAGVIFLAISGGLNVNFLAHAIGLVSGIVLPLLILKKRKN